MGVCGCLPALSLGCLDEGSPTFGLCPGTCRANLPNFPWRNTLGTCAWLKGGCRAPVGGKQPTASSTNSLLVCLALTLPAAALELLLGCSVLVSGKKTSR